MTSTFNRNPLQIWHQTEGDRLTAIAAALKTATGDAVDLTGCTVVFRMVHQDGTVKVDNEAAQIDDADEGEVSFLWASEDVDTPGTYFGYWIVTRTSDSKPDTYPHDGQRLQIEVVDRQ